MRCIDSLILLFGTILVFFFLGINLRKPLLEPIMEIIIQWQRSFNYLSLQHLDVCDSAQTYAALGKSYFTAAMQAPKERKRASS